MTSAGEWIGRVGDVWADEWRWTDRAFAPLTRGLMEAVAAVAPRGGRAIDIGCGAGETSIALADARPGLSVTGIDLSEALVAVARERAGGRANLDFASGDAVAAVAGYAPVDLMISRHGIMFFDDPVAAFRALHGAMAPGGRLAFSCFRDWTENAFARDLMALANEAPPSATAPGPFAFADPARVSLILGQAGWRDMAAEPLDFGYRVGAGDDPVGEAVRFLSRIGPAARALREAAAEDRPALRDAVARAAAARCQGGAVDFPAAAWIWSATA